MSTYNSLSINEKINAKGNSIILWGRNENRMIYRKRNDSIWDMAMYSPYRMLTHKKVYKEPK